MTEKILLKLVLLHVGVGLLIAICPFFSKIYAVLIVLMGFWLVVKNKNKNDEILLVIGYVVGSEVFLRTTFGNSIHEYGKYCMLFFSILGLIYQGKLNYRNPYWIFLLLIVPAISMSFFVLNYNFKNKILFEVLGPICLGILALYTFKKEISINKIKVLLNITALPLIALCVYLIIKYSFNAGFIDSKRSNFFYSGNYAPNQLATVLGLGLFIYFFKILFDKSSKKIFYINLIIFCVIFYRGLLTFSRGGIVTGLIVILSIILSVYISQPNDWHTKKKIWISLTLLLVVFTITTFQTKGNLITRYSYITTKKSIERDFRFNQLKYDFMFFNENPFLGIGVGKAKEMRKLIYNIKLSNHNEITRMLSEHGFLGILMIIILIFFPLKLYFNNLQNIYILPFFLFWLLTINHSATRIAAPSFIYALALLQIKRENETNIV